MPQSDNSKKALASVINKGIDAVLEQGPLEELLEEIKHKIAQTLREQTESPSEAVESLVRYYLAAQKQVETYKGIPVRTILEDEASDSSLSSLDNFSDAEFSKIQPELQKALQRCIDQAKESVEAYLESEIDEGLRDFGAWAKTVPIGGTNEKAFRAEAASVRSSLKAIASWHKRFFVIHRSDFYSWVEHILACHRSDTLAGKWEWSSYPECESHRNLNEKIYYLQNNWAEQAGLMLVSEGEYFENQPVPGASGCMCRYQYIYALRDLPDSVLTDLGRRKRSEMKKILAGLMEGEINKNKVQISWWKKLFNGRQ